MQENWKPIPFKQNTKFGGFIYCLANFLNNSDTLTYLNYFKERDLNDYYKNWVFNRIKGIYSRATISIEQKFRNDYFPGVIESKYQEQFKLSDYNPSIQFLYRVLFVEVFYTRNIKHFITIVKPEFDRFVFVIDSLNDYIMKYDNPDDVFKNYNVIGYYQIEDCMTGEELFTDDELKHIVTK